MTMMQYRTGYDVIGRIRGLQSTAAPTQSCGVSHQSHMDGKLRTRKATFKYVS